MADLEHRLAALCGVAEHELPDVRIERGVFVAYLRRRVRRDELDSLDPAALVELYLVAALREGKHAAQAVFEARYVASLGSRIGTIRLSDADLDEVKQRARAKLLVPDEAGVLRIEEYAGRGRLAGLVRVVVTREALTLKRRTQREDPLQEGDLAEPMADAWDPGIEVLKGKARAAFREAFSAAVRRLTPRERNLLRLHLLGGVTLESLAAMYGVHRATVVRWLAAARGTVLDETRKGLGASLRVRGPELESIMEAIRGSLDLSVERLLATLAPDSQDHPD